MNLPLVQQPFYAFPYPANGSMNAMFFHPAPQYSLGPEVSHGARAIRPLPQNSVNQIHIDAVQQHLLPSTSSVPSHVASSTETLRLVGHDEGWSSTPLSTRSRQSSRDSHDSIIVATPTSISPPKRKRGEKREKIDKERHVEVDWAAVIRPDRKRGAAHHADQALVGKYGEKLDTPKRWAYAHFLYSDSAHPQLEKTFGQIGRDEAVDVVSARLTYLRGRGGFVKSGSRWKLENTPVWSKEEQEEFEFWEGYQAMLKKEWKRRWPSYKLPSTLAKDTEASGTSVTPKPAKRRKKTSTGLSVPREVQPSNLDLAHLAPSGSMSSAAPMPTWSPRYEPECAVGGYVGQMNATAESMSRSGLNDQYGMLTVDPIMGTTPPDGMFPNNLSLCGSRVFGQVDPNDSYGLTEDDLLSFVATCKTFDGTSPNVADVSTSQCVISEGSWASLDPGEANVFATHVPALDLFNDFQFALPSTSTYLDSSITNVGRRGQTYSMDSLGDVNSSVIPNQLPSTELDPSLDSQWSMPVPLDAYDSSSNGLQQPPTDYYSVSDDLALFNKTFRP